MQVAQSRWTPAEGWRSVSEEPLKDPAQLILVFGSRTSLARVDALEELAREHAGALVAGCSTAGEISGTEVHDDSLIATAVHFESTQVGSASHEVSEPSESLEAGRALGRELPADGLRHVFVLSNGLSINGSDLVTGLLEELPDGVTVTGGLSGDGERFEETLVILGAEQSPNQVVALGLYGDSLRVGYGSLGGWEPFGPQRLISRSEGNVLHMLDDQPALELYQRYLGDHAKELPAASLLFPLHVTYPDGSRQVVRTILGMDDETGSMTFAGDMPQGGTARLMKASFEHLIDGAIGAAQAAQLVEGVPSLSILVSCVGRRMLLRQRIEEELEAVDECLGSSVVAGFYSYGEIAPTRANTRCELQNQTMAITTLFEV